MDNVQYIMEKFECPICGDRFSDVWVAFGHMSDKHTAEEQANASKMEDKANAN